MNLKTCLLDPLRAVLIMLERDRESIPMAEFKLTGGVYQVDLSDACATASNWFVLIQKPSTEFQVTLAGVKIASATRLPIVHKYFLQGVTTRRIDRPLFQHYFGPEVEIWEIQKSDDDLSDLSSKDIAYLDFLERFTRARVSPEVKAVESISKSIEKGSWRAAAWILEHRFPERWSLDRIANKAQTPERSELVVPSSEIEAKVEAILKLKRQSNAE
jgi:hypothetical protein